MRCLPSSASGSRTRALSISFSISLSHSLLKLFFAKKLATSARGCLPRNWVKVSASGQALVANTQKSESSFSLSLSISFTLGPHLWLGGSMSAAQHSRTIDYIGERGINTRTLTQGQWWSKRSTQLSHRLQCEARGGLNILQVKQYFSLTVCPLTSTSLVRGGGRYVGLFSEFGTSTYATAGEGGRFKRMRSGNAASASSAALATKSSFVVDMQRERERGKRGGERAKVFSF